MIKSQFLSLKLYSQHTS